MPLVAAEHLLLDCGLSYIYNSKGRSQQGLNSFPNYDNVYYTISSFSDNTASISAIKASLQSSPVLAAFEVWSDFFDYTSGIYKQTYGYDTGEGHAIVILGYDDVNSCWICRNSWGNGWGEVPPGGDHFNEAGYFRIGYGQCGIDARGNVTASVTSTTCFAKLIPNFQTINGAFSSRFANGEWAYALGNSTLSGNVSVASAATLDIKSGATVNLSSYSIASTGGTITVESGASVTGARLQNLNNAIIGLYPTIQATLNAATSGQTVYLPNSTYNENVTATNKSNLTVTGAGVNTTTISGTLTFNNCSNLQLWSTFWCWGENLYYINLGNFDSYVAGTSSTTGIALYSCTGFDQSGIVNYCSTGLFASGSSGLVQDGADFISNNTSVAASTGANVQVGDGQGIGPQFCTSVTYDFSAGPHGSINAYQCYYKNGSPRYYTYGGGTVGIYGPNYGCTGQSVSGPIAKTQNEVPSNVQSQSDDPAKAAFSQIDTSYFNLLRTIKDEARKNELSNNGQLHDEYLGVINDFKKFINNNPQSPLAIVALTTAANGFGVFGDYDEMKSFLNEIIPDSTLVQLKDAARDFMVDYYRNTKDYDGAISVADAFVNDCKNDSDLVADVILKKGLILHYNKNMPDNAAACFSTIVNNYPGTGAALFARNELQSMNNQANESTGSTGLAVSQGITMTNYPNPFNPTTTIAYQIPTDGHVAIKVFDILGRDVATLVDEFKPAGSYTVQFDASRLASGIYFYSIHAGEYTAVKKMLLLK